MIKPASDNVATRPRLRRPRRGRGDVAEYYRHVLRQLPWPGHDGSSPVRTLGVTSCVEGEGVSTLALQMAAAAASYEGYRVLLVDANLARPSLHRMLRLSCSPGLAEGLLDATQPGLNLQPSPDGSFSVLAAGHSDGRWQQAYDSPALAGILQGLKDGFDLVVWDLPAASQTTSAAQLAGLLDGTLLVVEADRVSWEVAHRTKELLCRAGARLVGAVLNKRRDYLPAWLYRKL